MNHEIIDVYSPEQERKRKAFRFFIVGIVVVSFVTMCAATAGYLDDDVAIRVLMACGAFSLLFLKFLHLAGERGLTPAGHFIATLGVVGVLLVAVGSMPFQIAGGLICGAVLLLIKMAERGRGFHA